MTRPKTQAGYREWFLQELAKTPGLEWVQRAWTDGRNGAIVLSVVPGRCVVVENGGLILIKIGEGDDFGVELDYQEFERLAVLIDCIRKADIAFIDGPARY